jgi:hypothetical protein
VAVHHSLGPARRTERLPSSRRQQRLSALRRRALPRLAFAGASGLALAGRLLPVDQGSPGGPAVEVAAIQGDVPHARNLPDLWRAARVTQYQAGATRAWPPRSGQAPGRCLTW